MKMSTTVASLVLILIAGSALSQVAYFDHGQSGIGFSFGWDHSEDFTDAYIGGIYGVYKGTVEAGLSYGRIYTPREYYAWALGVEVLPFRLSKGAWPLSVGWYAGIQLTGARVWGVKSEYTTCLSMLTLYHNISRTDDLSFMLFAAGGFAVTEDKPKTTGLVRAGVTVYLRTKSEKSELFFFLSPQVTVDGALFGYGVTVSMASAGL